MRLQFSQVLSGAIFLAAVNTIPLQAEDHMQAFVSSSGRIVFTNLVENVVPPAPAAVGPAAEVLQSEMPESLRTLVDSISTKHGVDPGLVRAVIKTESNFNQWAVSRKGAIGLMQLIPATGKRYGVENFFDAGQNVDGGVRYLKFLLEKFNGNVDLSLAAYNAGENLVERVGRIPAIPETTDYVRKVRSIYTRKSAGVGPVLPKPDDSAKEEPAIRAVPVVFAAVDVRGVRHFSNVAPPN
jgi:soluble lytic murein transglycosylase-like protein